MVISNRRSVDMAGMFGDRSRVAFKGGEYVPPTQEQPVVAQERQQFGDIMDALAQADAEKMSMIRDALGITQALPEAKVAGEWWKQPTQQPDLRDDAKAARTAQAQPTTPQTTEDAKAARTAAALPSDDIVRASIVKNSSNSSLSKSSIESQVRDIIGTNIKAAAALGAFSKESGDNFDNLTESNAYSLLGAYDSWRDSDVDRVLDTLDPEVRKRLVADKDAGIRTGGQASVGDRRILGDAMFDDKYEGGKDYKGRGLIHITHKSNYKAIGDRIGVDLVSNPELVNDPKYAVPAALAFLDLGGFFKADTEVTKDSLHNLVNRWSGTAVKDARWKAAEDYLSSWQSETPASDTPAPEPRPTQENQ
jgi:predicted chitinase